MPLDDESSGLDFIMKTIGRRRGAKNNVDTGDDDEGGDVGQNSGDEDEPEDPEDQLDHVDQVDPKAEATDRDFLAMVDPATMSAAQLEKVFGAHAANDLQGVFFQHTSRICSPARFLSKDSALTVRKSESALPRRYRKGQVDPSAMLLDCY